MVGLLRLVKMFGWEERVKTRLGDRRETELASLRKYYLYVLLNNNVTYAFLIGLSKSISYLTEVNTGGSFP